MTNTDVRFLNSGDTALVVEFGDRVDRELSNRVLALSERMRATEVHGVTETVPTYRSLLVHYDPLATDSARLEGTITTLLSEANAGRARARLWHIPACFSEQYAPDLEEVAQRTGVSAAEVVRLQLDISFHVY